MRKKLIAYVLKIFMSFIEKEEEEEEEDILNTA